MILYVIKMDQHYKKWFLNQIKSKDMRQLISMRNFIAKLFADMNSNYLPENREMMNILSHQWQIIRRELSSK